MSTQAAIIADDSMYVSWLEKQLGAALKLVRLKLEGATERALEKLAEFDGTDLLIIEFSNADPQRSVQLVESILDRYPNVPVLGLGNKVEQGTLLKAMRAGVGDFIDLSIPEDGEVSSRINKLLRRKPIASGNLRQGDLWAILSGAPTEGLAFFAEHLALSMTRKAAPGERVLLIDAAFPTGASLVFLNLNQSYSLVDALSDAQRCDETLIKTAFAHHSSGLYVLSLPEDQLGPLSVTSGQMESLLKTLRHYFSRIVIAADAVQPLPVLGLLVQQASRTLLLSNQSVLRSRHNRQLIHALDIAGVSLDNTALVVDNYQKRIGLEAEKLAELLNIPLLTKLPVNGEIRIEAMNSGKSLFEINPRDPYLQDVIALAHDMLKHGQENGQTKSRLLGKLFGANA